MFAKHFWTQGAAYWTLLFTVLVAITAFSKAQDAPANSSLIGLDPSEMANIVGGGSCDECDDRGQFECTSQISCASGTACSSFDDCRAAGASTSYRVCYYPGRFCSGSTIPGGANQCVEVRRGVGSKVYYCHCNQYSDDCATDSITYTGYDCHQNGPGTC